MGLVVLCQFAAFAALGVSGLRHHNPITDASSALDLSKCKKVFLDVGANIGVHERFLFDGDHYPLSKMMPHFKQFFGDNSARHVDHRLCAIGFEGNPRHEERLKKLETCYRSKGHQVAFYRSTVVSGPGQPDTKPFYSVTHGSQDLGAGIRATGNGRDGLSLTRYDVASVDLGAFVKDLRSKLPADATILMKMDIEGSEYEVLPGLEMNGVLCQKTGVDEITIEWHPKHAKTIYGEAAIQGKRERFMHAQFKHDPKTCKPTTLVEMDDETYVKDQEYPLEQVCPGLF